MNRRTRIIAISIASVLLVIVIAVIVACYIVFTPQYLTPIVRNQLQEQIEPNVTLDTVDLTFFSSFPYVALNVHNFSLTDTTEAKSLLKVDKLFAAINVPKFLFKGSIIVDRIFLNKSEVNIKVDTSGQENYNIFKETGIESEELDEAVLDESNELFSYLRLSSIEIKELNITYEDRQTLMSTSLTDLNLLLNGEMNEQDANINGLMKIAEFTFNSGDTFDVNFNNISLDVDVNLYDDNLLNLAFNDTKVVVNKTLLKVGDLAINTKGELKLMKDGIAVNLDYGLDRLNYSSITELIPSAFTYLLDDVELLHGDVAIDGKIEGTLNDTLYPTVLSNLHIYNSQIKHELLPYALDSINANLSTFVDINNVEPSVARINSLYLNMASNSFDVKGEVTDLLGDVVCDFKLNADTKLDELNVFIPTDLNVKMAGSVQLDASTRFLLADLVKNDIEKIYTKGKAEYQKLHIIYEDSLIIKNDKGIVDFNVPLAKDKRVIPNEIVELVMQGSRLKIEQLGVATVYGSSPILRVAMSDIFDATRVPNIDCSVSLSKMLVDMDTVKVTFVNPKGSVGIKPRKRDVKKPTLYSSYASEKLTMEMDNYLYVETDSIDLDIASRYDEMQKGFLLKWNPVIKVDFNNGRLKFAHLDTVNMQIPAIKFDYTPRAIRIYESNIIIGNSDFSLQGKLDNVRKFLQREALLEGELEYRSQMTDFDELFAITNSFYTDTTSVILTDTAEQTMQEVQSISLDTMTSERKLPPFMVPKKMDVVFNTHIENAIFNRKELSDIKGKLTVNSGNLVLEQIGLTSEAADMILTGVYRPINSDSLYTGFAFHMLDVDIAQLVELVPLVDSLMPMMTSFEGKAQFHMAGEAYFDKNYEIMLPTLRAAAAVEGKDLVLLDSETFSTISKSLMFSRKTRNVVDSVSVEMTILNDEMKIYPFLISMGKWQAVIAGEHNFDMNFNYHISVTDTPLPVRLGLDIVGDLDNMDYNLAKCRYKHLFRPKKRGVEDQETIETKRKISDALKATLKTAE